MDSIELAQNKALDLKDTEYAALMSHFRVDKASLELPLQVYRFTLAPNVQLTVLVMVQDSKLHVIRILDNDGFVEVAHDIEIAIESLARYFAD